MVVPVCSDDASTGTLSLSSDDSDATDNVGLDSTLYDKTKLLSECKEHDKGSKINATHLRSKENDTGSAINANGIRSKGSTTKRYT